MFRTQSRHYGLYHCPYTKVHIKGFGSSYLHVYACLLLCFMHVLAPLVLGFSMLAPAGLILFGYIWCPWGLVWMWPFGKHLWMSGCSVRTLPFLLCAMLCLPCLLMPPVGFLCIFTRLLTCPCTSLACQCVVHASTQWSYGHQSKPTFVPREHHLLFAFSLVFLLSYFFACHVYHAYLLYASFICPLHLFLPLLICWFLIFAFACTHMERRRMEIGHDLLSASKTGEDASMWI